MTTTNYIYDGKNGYQWLSPVVALQTAIRESVAAGHAVVPMDVEDFRRVMHDADSEDSRALQEQLETFARETGLRHVIDNHGQVVRFRGDGALPKMP